MKPSILILSLAAYAMLVANPVNIERIVVTDTSSDNDQLIADNNQTSGKQTFTTKSIAALSTQANMSPYTVIAFSPSVNFTPVDQAGSNEPSYEKYIATINAVDNYLVATGSPTTYQTGAPLGVYGSINLKF